MRNSASASVIPERLLPLRGPERPRVLAVIALELGGYPEQRSKEDGAVVASELDDAGLDQETAELDKMSRAIAALDLPVVHVMPHPSRLMPMRAARLRRIAISVDVRRWRRSPRPALNKSGAALRIDRPNGSSSFRNRTSSFCLDTDGAKQVRMGLRNHPNQHWKIKSFPLGRQLRESGVRPLSRN